MAYQISDECVACGTCAEECPVSAISEGEGKFQVKKCILTQHIRKHPSLHSERQPYQLSS